MKTSSGFEDIIAALTGTLGEIPFAKIKRSKLAAKLKELIDVSLTISFGDRTSRQLIIVTRNNGQPRLVREAINQLYRARKEFPGAYGIVGAPYISPASARICIEEGVGFVDMSGNCRLTFDKVFICREGSGNIFPEKRDLRSLYSPRATRVLRVFLNDPKHRWRFIPLAGEAGVSVGQIANVKKLLKDREWISEDSDGFFLIKPNDVLMEWRQIYTFRKNKLHDFYCMAEIPKIEADLAALCSAKKIPFSLTGFSGAARLVPGIRYQRIMAYAGSVDQEIIKGLGLKEVTSGANVSLLLPYDDGVFYAMRNVDNVPVVSPVQAYLDLAEFKGRGEEAAQIIYERILSPSWR